VKNFLVRVGEITLAILISTSFVSGIYFTYLADKRRSSYEFRIERYSELGSELSKLASGDPDPEGFSIQLNSALIFASDEVAAEVLKLNKLLTESKNKSIDEGKTKIEFSMDDLLPIFRAMRNDLLLESDLMDQQEFLLFLKPKSMSSKVIQE